MGYTAIGIAGEGVRGYSETLKEEFFNPKNFGKLIHPDIWIRITGVCGDMVEIALAIKEQRIQDIRFWTDGCGFTIACCSYVTQAAKGKPIGEAVQIKPEEVDAYFRGLPEENKHYTQLVVTSGKAAINKYSHTTL